MSSKTLCELCGHGSEDPKICSHCGRPIDAGTPTVVPPPPVHGRLRIRLAPGVSVEDWEVVRTTWLMFDDFLSWLPKQVDQFRSGAELVTVFGPEWLRARFQELLAGKVVVTFEPLPDAEIPFVRTTARG